MKLNAKERHTVAMLILGLASAGYFNIPMDTLDAYAMADYDAMMDGRGADYWNAEYLRYMRFMGL